MVRVIIYKNNKITFFKIDTFSNAWRNCSSVKFVSEGEGGHSDANFKSSWGSLLSQLRNRWGATPKKNPLCLVLNGRKKVKIYSA